MFACIFLTAGTITLFIGLDSIYFIEELDLNGIQVLIETDVDISNWLTELIFYQKINWAYLSVTWASIFFVKFAFLAFFRDLVDRLPRMQLYRRIVSVLTVLVFAYAVCDGFIACPQLGLDACKSFVADSSP